MLRRHDARDVDTTKITHTTTLIVWNMQVREIGWGDFILTNGPIVVVAEGRKEIGKGTMEGKTGNEDDCDH